MAKQLNGAVTVAVAVTGRAAAYPEPQRPGGREALDDVDEADRVPGGGSDLLDRQRKRVVARRPHDGGVPAVLDFDLR